MTMDDKQPYASTIAAEAVGERLGESTSEAANGNTERRPREPVATSAGPQARMAEKAAEAVGERIGDAYADATPDEARARSREVVRRAATQARSQSGAGNETATTSRQAAQALSQQLAQQPLVTVLAAFGLGYVAAWLIHRRGQ
jgi:hypothetical protein